MGMRFHSGACSDPDTPLPSDWAKKQKQNTHYFNPANGELVVGACVDTVTKDTFDDCAQIKKVTFLHTVSNPVIIGFEAFSFSGAQIVDVPPRATFKGGDAEDGQGGSFHVASALERLVFRDDSDYSLLKIEATAFRWSGLQGKEVLLPASVNMGNICVSGFDRAKSDWANLCGKAVLDMKPHDRSSTQPIFKRASGACPGNGWGACDCVLTSGSFACNALPSDVTLVVPSCVTTIPANAFSGCAQITSFDLTQATRLQSVGAGFLKNTPKLAEVKGLANLPGGVIPNQAFKNSGIGSISIPKQIVRIDSGAFEGSELTTLTFEGGRSSDLAIENHAFPFTTKLVQELVLPATTAELGEYSFAGSGITAVRAEAGSKLTNIGRGAFKMTEQLTTAVLPPSVESIGESAFEGSAVETVAFEGSSNLKSIGKNAFKDAAKLSGFTRPSFGGVRHTLPAGVTIGGGAFAGAPTGVVKASSYTIDGVPSSCPAGATLG
jgi:hypothetical protein